MFRDFLLCSLLLGRFLAMTAQDIYFRETLVIAGNFSLDGQLVNIAEYDISTGDWSTDYKADLYLYGESNGIIWDTVLNSTDDPYNRIYVVGAFDSVSELSQIQYCSVGQWNGLYFQKVGEGLCPRGQASSTTIKVETIVLGTKGDLYVGGSFESRVWDGTRFVDVHHVAQFNGERNQWLPLSTGMLNCSSGNIPRVSALSWDESHSVLYIGGNFDLIGETIISSGLAMWTEKYGLRTLSGRGVTRGIDGESPGVVISLAFESKTESLFIAGDYEQVNGIDCQNVAVWWRKKNEWTCLGEPLHAINPVTTAYLGPDYYFLSGRAAPSSNWTTKDTSLQHVVSRMDIRGYIEERIIEYLFNDTSISALSTQNYSNFDEITHFPHRNIIPDLDTSQRSSIKRNSAISTHRTKQRRRLRARRSSTSKRFKGYSSTQDLEKIWSPSWEWLPGFTGANGPIHKIHTGEGPFRNSIFIVGEFSNYPPVVIWTESDDSKGGGQAVGIKSHHTIQGLVTSIMQVNMPYEVKILPTPPPTEPPQDFTILILLGFMLIGIALGVGFALGCGSTYAKLPKTESDADLQADTRDIMIPLGTFGGSATGVDFRECFEKAMKARHLPMHEALLIINSKEIVLSRIIGEGSFGRVWSGQWRNNNVAVKEFVFAQTAIVGGSIDRHHLIEEIVGEAGIMACLRHPKILQLYGCSLTMQAIWIVSELCLRGSLRMVLDDHSTRLSLLNQVSLCLDIADGMLYLHSRTPPIIHRDLKSQNIFITEMSGNHLVAKIGDWGSARAVALGGPKSMTHGVGTACWLAPEVINKAHFSKDSDVYAFGIILWEVSTRSEVYPGFSAAQIISKVAHEGLRPKVPHDCPWASIMTECWKQNPSDRPGFHRILAQLSGIYTDIKSKEKQSSGGSVSGSAPLSFIHSSSIVAGKGKIEAGGKSSDDYSLMKPSVMESIGKEVYRPYHSMDGPHVYKQQFSIDAIRRPNALSAGVGAGGATAGATSAFQSVKRPQKDSEGRVVSRSNIINDTASSRSISALASKIPENEAQIEDIYLEPRFQARTLSDPMIYEGFRKEIVSEVATSASRLKSEQMPEYQSYQNQILPPPASAPAPATNTATATATAKSTAFNAMDLAQIEDERAMNPLISASGIDRNSTVSTSILKSTLRHDNHRSLHVNAENFESLSPTSMGLATTYVNSPMVSLLNDFSEGESSAAKASNSPYRENLMKRRVTKERKIKSGETSSEDEREEIKRSVFQSGSRQRNSRFEDDPYAGGYDTT